MKIFLTLLFLALSLPAQAQYAHRSNPGTPGATAPAITAAGGTTTCPGTGCVALNTGGTSTLIVKVGGTWTATLSFRCSNDNWASTASQTAYPLTNGILGAGVTTTAANGTWSVPTSGYLSCGVYADAFTSNTSMAVNLDADPANSTLGISGVPGAAPVQVQGVTASGAAPGTENPVMMGAYDTANMQRVQSDSSGRLKVVGAGANNAATTGNPVLIGGTSVAGGTNTQTLTVKAGSVLAAATDQAAVVTYRETLANDTSNIANGIETQPAVARAGPSSMTAGRSEKLQADTLGGLYVSEIPTTNATGLTTTGIATVGASQSIKASAGNVYGFGVVNGAGAGCWLQCVNSSGAGTLGTAVIFQAPLPTSLTAYSPPGPIPLGSFSTGIACGVASAINGASACGTAATGVAIYYK